MKKSLYAVFNFVLIILSLTLIFASCDESADNTTPETTIVENSTVPEETTEELSTAPEETTEELSTAPEETTGAPHTHVWSDWSETIAATCTSEGQEERTCTCGEKETGSIAMLEHTEIIDSAIAPTCTTEGMTEGKHCSVCFVTTVAQNTIPALGHTEIIDSAIAPTCTKAGKTEGKHCSVCSAITVAQNTITALGHTEIIDSAIAPTCTKAGKTEGKHCSVCSATTVAQNTIPALGHTEVIDAAVPATCTTPGLTEGKHCSVCNVDTIPQNIVKAFGHTEVVDAAVPATCTSTGLTEGKHCSVCNVVLKEQKETPISDHNFSDWKVGVAETCTTDGSRIRECVCGEKLERGVFAAHHYVYNGTTGKCSGCGDVVTYTDGLIFTLSGDQSYYIWTDITFHKDTTVTEIILPPMYNSLPVKDIKVDARGLENLKRIVLPDGIESITKCWMQGSPSFVSINFPDGLKTIGKEAFLISATGTANLTDIRLPSTLISIGKSAFLPDRFWSDNRYHKYISVAYGNPVYHSQDNCLIETQTKTLITGTALSVIPNDGSVTKIGYGAFLALPELINVVIPDTITEIDVYAFLNCENLESVHFGAGYTPSQNFYTIFGQDVRYVKLKQITVSENNPSIYAVNNCLIEKATKTILLGCNTSIIPTDGSVTKIGAMAFRNCTFDTIYIPVTIKEIARGAFLGTCMVNDDNYDGIYGTIYYEGTVAEWEQIIIGGAVFDHKGGPDREIPVVCSDGTTSVKSVVAMIA